jgi:DNA-binding MarR family transcriptional regulator
VSVASTPSEKRLSGGLHAAGTASKARLRVWLRILKVSRMIERELRERLRVEFDTTLPRFDVMAALYRAEEGLNMSELSGVLRVSNGNVTGIVDRLVGDDLIVRVPVEGDRRAMIVRLTKKGRTHFCELAEAHEGWVSELLRSVDAPEAEKLIAQLGAIGSRLDRLKAAEE